MRNDYSKLKSLVTAGVLTASSSYVSAMWHATDSFGNGKQNFAPPMSRIMTDLDNNGVSPNFARHALTLAESLQASAPARQPENKAAVTARFQQTLHATPTLG